MSIVHYCYNLPFQPTFRKNTFENIVGNEENASNLYFPAFPH